MFQKGLIISVHNTHGDAYLWILGTHLTCISLESSIKSQSEKMLPFTLTLHLFVQHTEHDIRFTLNLFVEKIASCWRFLLRSLAESRSNVHEGSHLAYYVTFTWPRVKDPWSSGAPSMPSEYVLLSPGHLCCLFHIYQKSYRYYHISLGQTTATKDTFWAQIWNPAGSAEVSLSTSKMSLFSTCAEFTQDGWLLMHFSKIQALCVKILSLFVQGSPFRYFAEEST